MHLYPPLLDDVADFNVLDGIQHGDSGFNEHIFTNVGLLDSQIGHAFQFVTGVFPIAFQPVLRGFNVDFRQVLADFQESFFFQLVEITVDGGSPAGTGCHNYWRIFRCSCRARSA